MVLLGSNPCGFDNGGCTHLCLAKADGYTCACPTIPDNEVCLTGKKKVEHCQKRQEKTDTVNCFVNIVQCYFVRVQQAIFSTKQIIVPFDTQ